MFTVGSSVTLTWKFGLRMNPSYNAWRPTLTSSFRKLLICNLQMADPSLEFRYVRRRPVMDSSKQLSMGTRWFSGLSSLFFRLKTSMVPLHPFTSRTWSTSRDSTIVMASLSSSSHPMELTMDQSEPCPRAESSWLPISSLTPNTTWISSFNINPEGQPWSWSIGVGGLTTGSSSIMKFPSKVCCPIYPITPRLGLHPFSPSISWLSHPIQKSRSHFSLIPDFAAWLEGIFNHSQTSVNFYMFHGGTNLGFMAGANRIDAAPGYAPDVTSYGELGLRQ